MHEASESGVPAMRPLMLDYPNDEGTYGIDDELLFGSDLLVAPVLEEGAKNRGVYLPAGDWYDYWSGARVSGGKSIDVPVTLASIPMYVRAGAFLFEQPVVQHTGEMPGQPLDVTLFAGVPSERWLYEDDGNSFDYKRGAFMRRRFASRRDGNAIVIEIGAPEGTYRPKARSLVLTVRGQTATRVSVPNAKVEMKDGSVVVTVPDRFEATTIRIE